MTGKKTKDGDVRSLLPEVSRFKSKSVRLRSNREFALEAWRATTDRLEGMTADMARDFSDVELDEADNFVVTLSDKVNRDFCNKPERKQLIESVLSDVAKKATTIKFLAAAKDLPPVASKREPTLAERNTEAVSTASKLLDRLSETWVEIEKALLKDGVLAPVEMGIDLVHDADENPIGEEQFGLQKINSRWRVCCRYYHFHAPPHASQDWTPVTESSIDDRMVLLDHVDDLRKAIVTGNEACVLRIEEANKKSKAILKRLRG